jgi:hypothetical protein
MNGATIIFLTEKHFPGGVLPSQKKKTFGNVLFTATTM